MGKTIDLLRKVEQERLDKNTFVTERAIPVKAISKPEPVGAPLNIGLGKTGILVLIGLLLIFNLALVITVIGLFTQRAGTFTKLTAIEQSIAENGKQISAIHAQAAPLTDEVKAVNLHIKDISETLTKLEETNDAQATALENLNKAKDTLFNRVSSLEAQISQ